MRATDVVRSILDLLDSIESQSTSGPTAGSPEDNESRFKQIFTAIAKQKAGPYSNTPMEIVTDVDSVTTKVGGGPNGIKHPDDIRIKDPRGYE